MDPVVVVVVLALIATVAALFLGLLAMSTGGAVDREFSTRLMWVRVGLQAITIAALLGALYLR
jgi:Hypoxia induced protein conserved region